MHFHKWSVLKAGGGVMRSPSDVLSLVELLESLPYNVLVVSAFFGQTRTLRKIIEEKEGKYFDEFWEYHLDMVKELWLSKKLFQICPGVGKSFDDSFKMLCASQVGSFEYESACASILSLGEEMSLRIVTECLKRSMRKHVIMLDARSVVATRPGVLVDAEIDQERSSFLIKTSIRDMKSLYVIQGFVAGLPGENTTTTVLHSDGSDVSAALIASCLSYGGQKVDLTYLKRSEGDERLPPKVTGIGKLTDYMKSTKKTVVSPRIQLVVGLPDHFIIKDIDPKVPEVYITVSEPVTREWRKQNGYGD
jgi:aspartokinase